MIEDDLDAGQRAGDFGGFPEMPVRHPHVPGQSVFLEEGQIAEPQVVLHGARVPRDRLVRRFGNLGFGPNASDQRIIGLSGEDLLRVGAGQGRPRHDRIRHAGSLMEVRQPIRFIQRVADMPVRFDMDRLDDVVPFRVPPVVLGQVVAPQDVVLAERKARQRLIRQPRIVEGIEIPEVMVRIDDLEVGHDCVSGRIGAGAPESSGSGAYGFHSGRASAPVR